VGKGEGDKGGGGGGNGHGDCTYWGCEREFWFFFYILDGEAMLAVILVAFLAWLFLSFPLIPLLSASDLTPCKTSLCYRLPPCTQSNLSNLNPFDSIVGFSSMFSLR